MTKLKLAITCCALAMLFRATVCNKDEDNAPRKPTAGRPGPAPDLRVSAHSLNINNGILCIECERRDKAPCACKNACDYRCKWKNNEPWGWTGEQCVSPDDYWYSDKDTFGNNFACYDCNVMVVASDSECPPCNVGNGYYCACKPHPTRPWTCLSGTASCKYLGKNMAAWQGDVKNTYYGNVCN